MQMFQIGDWVTQYSVGYWQVVDIKAKYAEEDSGYGKQFWKKGEQIGKWVFLKKAFTPKMKIQIRSECGVKLLPMRKEPKSKNILQIIRMIGSAFVIHQW